MSGSLFEAGLRRIGSHDRTVAERKIRAPGSRKMTTIDSIPRSILRHSVGRPESKRVRKRRRMRGMQWARREVVRAPTSTSLHRPCRILLFSPRATGFPLPFPSNELRPVAFVFLSPSPVSFKSSALELFVSLR